MFVGARVQRVEDRRLVTGAARFVAGERPPGGLHAAFVRSTVAHGHLRRVELDAARAAVGVVGVWTAEELDWVAPFRPSGPAGLHTPAYRALATGKVRFAGEPVAVVVAESPAAAEDAVGLIDVDVEPIDAVVTIDDALDPRRPSLFDEVGSNVLFQRRQVWGDPDAAFGAASRVVGLDLVLGRQANCPLEGRGIVVRPDPSARSIDVVAAHQNPHALRLALAQHLGLPAHAVVVRCGDIGGSFGQKAYVSREEVAVAAIALATGRPVSWIEERSENLLAAGQARDERLRIEAAVDDDGVVLALRAAMTLNQGAYQLTTLPSSIFPTLVGVLLPNCYRIDDYAFEATVVASNHGPTVAYRGPWAAETFARERLLDRIAAEAGIDPVEVRRRNLLRAADQPRRMVTGPTLAFVTADQTLEAAVARADLPSFRRCQVEARAEGRYLGVGLATFAEPAPGPPDYAAALGVGASPRTAQRAVARLEPDGTLTVFTSQSPHGQGHETTLGQLAADGLGVGLDAARVVVGDTRLTPFNLVGTGGSRAATLASGAVVGAVDELRERVSAIAAHVLEASPADIEVVDGVARVRGTPTAALTLAEVGRIAYVETARLPGDAAPGLEAAFDYAIPMGGWSQATHVCWVEVDADLGSVRILRYLVVGDCGAMINPAIVEGQVRGGVAQGIAGVLFERVAMSPDGQPLTTTLADYLVPAATEIPPIEVHHLASPPQGPIDHRGVGEGGAIGAPPALVNAIEDALAPFGVVLTEQHLPPQRIAELLGRVSAGT